MVMSEQTPLRFPPRGLTPGSAPAPPRRPEPLPKPTGQPVPADAGGAAAGREDEQIRSAEHLIFHLVGDVGGVGGAAEPTGRRRRDGPRRARAADPARFAYLMGDVVYYNGEADQYYPQFYEPYADYPCPIFSVPGNHDGTPLAGLRQPAGLDGQLRHPAPARSPGCPGRAPADHDPTQLLLDADQPAA